MTMPNEDPARQVVDVLTGAWRAQALYAAAALKLPDHVTAGHDTPELLAAAAGADQDALERLMRLLTGMGVFEETPDGAWKPTPVSALLRSDDPGSLRDMAVIYGEEFYEAWGKAVPAVRTGVSGFEHAFGLPLGAHLEKFPETARKFQRAMNAGSLFFEDVAADGEFAACRSVVDVGGGSGTLLAAVLRAHPHLEGVLFDLPHVVAGAAERLEREVGPGRWRTASGDVFEAVPPGGDVYLLSRILQDWDDERCARLLANIRAAMPDTGRLLIVERVIRSDGSEPLALLWDVHLLMAAGGRERTLDAYRSLLAGAGLRLSSVKQAALETSLLVAEPV
jgi:hypothetical protein